MPGTRTGTGQERKEPGLRVCPSPTCREAPLPPPTAPVDRDRTEVGRQVTVRAHLPGQHGPAGPPTRPWRHVRPRLCPHLTCCPSPLEHLHVPPLPTRLSPLLFLYPCLWSLSLWLSLLLCPCVPRLSLSLSAALLSLCPQVLPIPHPIRPSRRNGRRVDRSRAEAPGPRTAWAPIPACRLLAL